jgi:hypothetical protein
MARNCAKLFRVLEAQRFTGDSFKFKKRTQHFIATSDKALSVVLMRVNDPDRAPV